MLSSKTSRRAHSSDRSKSFTTRRVLPFAFLCFVSMTHGVATAQVTGVFTLPDGSGCYDPASGSGSVLVPLLLQETSPGAPRELLGFSMSFAYDPGLLTATSLTAGDAFVDADFFAPALYPVEAEVTLGVVRHLVPPAIPDPLFIDTPTEAGTVVFETVPAAFVGASGTVVTPLTWQTSTASTTPVENHVVFGPSTATVRIVPAVVDGSASLSEGDLVPGFSLDLEAGTAPLTVSFFDQTSSSFPVQYAWDFDSDGTPDAFEPSPQFTYEAPGVYVVTLEVTTGCQQATSTGTVTVFQEPVPTTQPFVRGDCNDDAQFNIGDPVTLLSQLFAGAAPAPCQDACDANDDGSVDIGDAIFMLSALFLPGSPFPPPPSECGEDPTPDETPCDAFGCPGPVDCTIDLDIDSDNDDGICPPERSLEEDSIEDMPDGKFIRLNDDDDNFNGIPDLMEEPPGLAPADCMAGCECSPACDDDLVPLVLELMPNAFPGFWRLTYSSTVEVYDESNQIIPSGVIHPCPMSPNPMNARVEGVALGPATITLEYDCDGDGAFELSDTVQAYVPRGESGDMPRLAYGGKHRRVDVHGVPLADRSPDGEGEDDRYPHLASIDTYDLNPTLSMADAGVQVEGGELSLVFRRTGGVRSFVYSFDPRKQSITYSSDFTTGLGWDNNLSSRVIIARTPCDDDPDRLQVTDEVGTSYTYLDHGGSGPGAPFPPDTYHSFNNSAVRAVLHREDPDTIVLTKLFGTRVTYQRVGLFAPPDPSSQYREEYYRIVSVEDRNGNRLEYLYASDDPGLRTSFLVSELREAAHPERRLSFEYSLGTGPNGDDRGDRLISVTDPLGRVTSYSYSDSPGAPWQLLAQVTRPVVLDAENGLTPTAPVTTYTYHTAELPSETTPFPPLIPGEDPLTRSRTVGPAVITDARGHTTTLSYDTGFYPSSVGPGGMIHYYQERLRLTSATTIDGTATFGESERDFDRVVTHAIDTTGHEVTYDFQSEVTPALNEIGAAIYVTQLERTTESISGTPSATYAWTADFYSNLVSVLDMSGNTIEYEYGTLASRQSDQPTRSILTDSALGESIIKDYEYGAFNKMTRYVDGEGKEELHTLDSSGNRTDVVEELGCVYHYEYAPDGFISLIEDPDGRTTTMTRSFTPGDLDHYYTVTSVVTGYAGELSITSSQTYDVVGNLTREIDGNGNVSTYEYDDLDRRTRSHRPPVPTTLGGPAVPSFSESRYTLNGQVAEFLDDLGNSTTTEYDLFGRVVRERRRMVSPAVDDDTLDLIQVWAYTPVGLVESVIDPEGNVTSYEYDALQRVTERVADADGLGLVTQYFYHDNSGPGAFSYTSGWKATRIINARGFAQDTVYDGFYRPTCVVDRHDDGTGRAFDEPPASDEPACFSTFDRVHNVTSITTLAESGAGGDRRRYTFYDDLHRPTVEILDFDGDGLDGTPYPPQFVSDPESFVGHDAEDFVTRTVYDLAGNTVRTIDAEGNATDTTYDGFGRVVEVRLPNVLGGRPTQTKVYDDNSNEVLTTDPNGNQRHHDYDSRNRMIRTVLDLDGNGTFDPSRPGPDLIMEWEYDLVGNRTRTIDANGNERDFTFDRRYRLIEVRGPPVPDAENGGALTRPLTETIYDRNSNVVEVIDPRGVSTRSSYDGLDRVIQVTNAFGTADAVSSATEYDANGNVTALVFDGIQRSEFTYDAFDRQVTEAWPGGNLTTSEYYRNGLVATLTDPKSQTVDKTYDRANRVVLSERRRSDSSLEETRTFEYDRAGNTTQVQDAAGTSQYGYDALYRPVLETRSDIGQVAYTVTSEFDRVGNRTRCVYPDTGREVTATYDRNNRLVEVQDSGVANPTTFAYDSNGNLTTQTQANGVIETFTYDGLDRVALHTSTFGGSTIYSASYAYDLADRRREIAEELQGQTPRTTSYDYDAQYRLVGETSSGDSTLYEYDVFGNRVSRVSPGSVTSYTYNDRNELLSSTENGVPTSYTYDANGNLVERVEAGGSTTEYEWDVSDRLRLARIDGVVEFEATYDYRTRRVSKDDDGQQTHFKYDQGLAVQETTGGPTPTLRVEFVRGIDMGGGVGSILYASRAPPGTVETYCYNAVGHTVALTSPAGAVVATDYYSAFGEIVSSTGSTDNDRLANTKERDASTGLDNHGFRYYDAALGRYIQRDPLGYADGLNPYAYVHNDPINRFDPLGLWDFWNNPIWDAVEVVSDFSAGVGDKLTGGLTQKVRQAMGTDDCVNKNSGAYRSGEVTGVVLDVGITVGTLGQSAVAKEAGKQGLKKVVVEILEEEAKSELKQRATNLALDRGGDVAKAMGADPELVDNATAVVKLTNQVRSLNSDRKEIAKGRTQSGASPEAPSPGKGPAQGEGIIYKRTDPKTGEIYIGQAKSEKRFAERQKEHDRKLGQEHEYEVIDRADPGIDLDVAEHNRIQEATGGVRAKDSPKVANKKDPVGAKRRKELGLPEPRRLDDD